jgi:hypothetical protein
LALIYRIQHRSEMRAFSPKNASSAAAWLSARVRVDAQEALGVVREAMRAVGYPSRLIERVA